MRKSQNELISNKAIYKAFLIIAFCISITACDHSRESVFIHTLNKHNANDLMHIQHFEFNNKIYSKKDLISMAKYDQIVGLTYELDSVHVMGDSSLLYTHWINRIHLKYDIPPFSTNILLKFRENKVYEARFNDVTRSDYTEYNYHFEKYLIWLETKHPELYLQLDKIGERALNDDSLFIEYTRLLYLKLDDYSPELNDHNPD